MATRQDADESPERLRRRIRQLKGQLTSQQDLESLIQNLTTHQEELRIQQVSLVEAQHELESSRDRYAELYDFAPIPIFTLSANGVLESMNLAAARLLGVERPRAIGMPLLAYVRESSRRDFLDHITRCRQVNGTVRSQITLRGPNHVEVPVEIQSKGFEPHDGVKIVYQTVAIDQSERLRHDEERRHILERQERILREESAARAASEAKDRFLAVLSHELRTPLTPVLLTLETLDDVDGVPPSVRRGLSVIRRNSEVLARLIDDLLDVTRIVHDKLHVVKTPVSVDAVLRSVVEMCESDVEHLGARLDLHLDAVDAWVLGDELRLRQIFWNLLKNAIQHTPPHGRIEVRSEPAGRRSLQISVSDTGEGIEADDAERLFEPFQQSKQSRPGSGLGLGLAICRGLVEAHGGSIRVASAGPDHGATLRVELPTCQPPAGIVPREPVAPVEREPLRVLVVEDHADTAEAMRLVLSRYGYQVRVASTLEEARRAADDPFDVLVSDLQLPDGSGLDLMRGLSAEHDVKGIAMSGFGTEKDVSRSLEAGFHLHLVKPVDIHRMVDAIRALAHGEKTARRRA